MKSITAKQASIMFPEAMRAQFETDILLASLQGKVPCTDFNVWLSRQENEQRFAECDGELRANYVNAFPDEWEFWGPKGWDLLYI